MPEISIKSGAKNRSLSQVVEVKQNKGKPLGLVIAGKFIASELPYRT